MTDRFEFAQTYVLISQVVSENLKERAAGTDGFDDTTLTALAVTDHEPLPAE